MSPDSNFWSVVFEILRGRTDTQALSKTIPARSTAGAQVKMTGKGAHKRKMTREWVASEQRFNVPLDTL